MGLENDFVSLITNNQFIVDRTGFIAQFLDSSSKIFYVSRPEKSGKTVLLRMVQSFLSDSGLRSFIIIVLVLNDTQNTYS